MDTQKDLIPLSRRSLLFRVWNGNDGYITAVRLCRQGENRRPVVENSHHLYNVTASSANSPLSDDCSMDLNWAEIVSRTLTTSLDDAQEVLQIGQLRFFVHSEILPLSSLSKSLPDFALHFSQKRRSFCQRKDSFFLSPFCLSPPISCQNRLPEWFFLLVLRDRGTRPTPALPPPPSFARIARTVLRRTQFALPVCFSSRLSRPPWTPCLTRTILK